MTKVGGRLGDSGKRRAAIKLVLAYAGFGPFFAWVAGSFIVLMYGVALSMIPPRQGEFLFAILAIAVLLPFFYGIGVLPALLTGYLTARTIVREGECSRLRSTLYGCIASAVIVYPLFLMFGMPHGEVLSARTLGFLIFQSVLGLVGTTQTWTQTSALRRKLASACLLVQSSADVIAPTQAPPV